MDFDIDLLVIKLIKQRAAITLSDLSQVVKEASLLCNQYITQYLKEIELIDNILTLDDDVPLKDLKKKLATIKTNIGNGYVRTSTLSMIKYIKENFIDIEQLSQEEIAYMNDLFDSLIEMQKLYNFIKHFVKTFNDQTWIDELQKTLEQEKMKQKTEEISKKRISLLKEMEEVQFKIIDLKHEKDKWWNKLIGKSKEIEFYIQALEDKLCLLRKQFDELTL